MRQWMIKVKLLFGTQYKKIDCKPQKIKYRNIENLNWMLCLYDCSNMYVINFTELNYSQTKLSNLIEAPCFFNTL